MYEFFVYNNFKKSKRKKENYETDEEETVSHVDILFVVCYLILFAMAIHKALQVQNKALHLMFSTISPIIYLICYHLVPDFKNT